MIESGSRASWVSSIRIATARSAARVSFLVLLAVLIALANCSSTDAPSGGVGTTSQDDNTTNQRAVDCGGGAAGSFVADQGFNGGLTFATTAQVSTAGVAGAAPEAVYQTQRYGDFTYVFAGLTPGATYTVRLHFAEIYWTSAGKRVFNVLINDKVVLANYDLYADVGGLKAVVKTASATADAHGKVRIYFESLVDNAEANGIEVLAPGSVPDAGPGDSGSPQDSGIGPQDSGTAHDSGSPQPDSGGPAGCPSTAVNLSTFGSAGQGSDDTGVIQKAINSTAGANQTLHIPVGHTSYIVGPLSIPSNASLCLDSGVVFEARAGYGTNDVMFAVYGSSNVSILGYGATFHMNPSEYATDSDPEFRHCVSIIGSSTVHVAGFKCVTFGGDGLYIAGNSNGVLAEDFTADGSTRDGLTFISAKNSTVRRSHFINGHTAVDMEPNVATDALINVLLEDSDSTDNHYGGVNVSLYAYNSSTPPAGIIIRRHTDKNTANGATDWHAGTSFSANGTNGVAAGGSVLFDSCTSINAGAAAGGAWWWTANGPSVTFQNLTATNPNQNGLTYLGAATIVGRGGGGAGDQGNSFFYGTSITSTDGKITYYFNYYDGSGFPFSNVKWMNPGTLSGATKAPPNGLFNGAGVSSVNQ